MMRMTYPTYPNTKSTVIISDVDGVLNTGQFLISKNGKEYKTFGAHDNDGYKMLKNLGFHIVFITADKRGYDITYERICNEMHAGLHLVSENDRTQWIKNYVSDNYYKNYIYIADGISDVPALSDALISIVPKNGRKEAKKVATYVTESNSGEGAFLDAALYIISKYNNESIIDKNICLDNDREFNSNDFYNKNVEYSQKSAYFKNYANIVKTVISQNFDILSRVNTTQVRMFLDLLTQYKNSNKNIIGVAAGRMGYSLRSFIMRLMHLGYNATFYGDTNVPYPTEDTLIIFNSSSGETKSLVLYADIIRKLSPKSYIITVTSNPKSTLAEKSDFVLTLPKLSDNLFYMDQPMKTVNEQSSMLFFDIMVPMLMEMLHMKNENLVKNHSILE